MTDETIEKFQKKNYSKISKNSNKSLRRIFFNATLETTRMCLSSSQKGPLFFFFFSFLSLSSDALTQQCNVCRVHRHALQGPWETAGTGRWLLRHRRRIEMLRSAGSNFVVDFSSNFEFISNKHILKFAGASNFFFKS